MSDLTRTRTWLPVASSAAIRGTPGKFRSMIHNRWGVNTCGCSARARSSSACSASPLSRPPLVPALSPPAGPHTTARVARVSASETCR